MISKNTMRQLDEINHKAQQRLRFLCWVEKVAWTMCVVFWLIGVVLVVMEVLE